jgi:hypothetical protein
LIVSVLLNRGQWDENQPKDFWVREGDEVNLKKGRVATLHSPRGRLAGCSSWHLRFVTYSSGGI